MQKALHKGLHKLGLPEPVVNLITEADVETAHGAMFSDRTRFGTINWHVKPQPYNPK